MNKILMILATVFAFQAQAEEISDKYLNEVFARVSKEVDVPEKLLRAVCWSESHFNTEAYNHGDGSGMNHAFGICQVLYKTAVEYGFKDLNCEKSFLDHTNAKGKLVKASRTYSDCKLFGAYTNIYYAAKYLKSRMNMYDGSWIFGIAAYNTGTLRMCKTGKVYRLKDHSVIARCIKGGILNQEYIDNVLQALQENH